MRPALLAVCALLAGCNSPVSVSNTEGARFQIAADAKGGAVWKLNTVTGELWVCAPSEGKVACAKAPEEKPAAK
jgi:hypothetical protein